MSRPKKSFADHLDEFLAEATEIEIRDIAIRLQIWARWRKLGFTVRVEPVTRPLLDEPKNGAPPK